MLTKEQQDLVMENERLVKFIAGKYSNVAQTYTYSDLVQIGYLGLIKAAETYDETKGAFSTHAYSMIRYAILNELRDTDRLIRIPGNILPIVCEFKREHPRDFEGGWVSADVREFVKFHGYPKGIEKTLSYALCTEGILSIDNPEAYNPTNGGRILLEDILVDKCPTPEQVVMVSDAKERVNEMLIMLENAGISHKNISIFKKYYGIGTEPQTCRQIGKEYGLSETRISQILKKTEMRLKYHFQNERELLESYEEFDMCDYE